MREMQLPGASFSIGGMGRMPPKSSPQSVEAVAERLRWTRAALNLTAAEFCRRADIRQNAYANWEALRSRPDLESALRLCTAFGLTLDWIYRGEPSGLRQDFAAKLLPLMWGRHTSRGA